MQRTNILGSEISIGNLFETVEAMRALISRQQKGFVCVSNVHTVVMGYFDREYSKITNQAALATADGVPLIWASKLLRGNPIHGRASGPDIMAECFRNKAWKDVRHYFYGSTPDVLTKLEGTLRTRYPEISLAGLDSPPFRPQVSADVPLSDAELRDCEKINAAKADIVWVGLGAPKQELWMYRARAALDAPLLVGVGAAFDFLAGNKKRAPEWMQKSGLEWAFRWSQEPRRLATRYLKTNPVFVAAVTGQALKQRLLSRSS